MTQDFYPDLKNLEDGLYAPELVEEFIAVPPPSNIEIRTLEDPLERIICHQREIQEQTHRPLQKNLQHQASRGNPPLLLQLRPEYPLPYSEKIKTLTTFLSSPNGNMMFDHF